MPVNEKIAFEHGLKSDEYKKICKLLKEHLTLLSWVYFLQCGMNIAPINLHEFI